MFGPKGWSPSFDAIKGTFERLTDLRVARASHILVKGFDDSLVQQMKEWKEEIGNDPEKFKARAQQSSLCPSRVKGGDLGYFTRGKSTNAAASVPLPLRRAHHTHCPLPAIITRTDQNLRCLAQWSRNLTRLSSRLSQGQYMGQSGRT